MGTHQHWQRRTEHATDRRVGGWQREASSEGWALYRLVNHCLLMRQPTVNAGLKTFPTS